MRQKSVCAWVLVVVGVLSDRVVGAPVSWVNPGDGFWLTASNWSSNPTLPGNTDDVTISQPGILTITLDATPPEIHSLAMSENLFSNTPSELVVGSGGGFIGGTITLQNGRINSKGGTLQIQNTVNNDVSGLKVVAGGKMLFSPGVLPTINGRSELQTRLEADGANSLLDLSGVTTFTGGGFNNSAILASNGGTIELDNIADITTGATFVEANGANSKIDLSALTSFSRTNFADSGELRAVNGGKLITPNLTSLGRVTVLLDGPTSSINLGGITSADFASFRASSGATVAPVSLTSYDAGANGPLFQADGANSLIDLTPITTFNGGTFSSARVIANSGGHIELNGVASISTGATNVEANGTGSVVDLTALTTFSRTNFSDIGRLRVTGGGSILTPNLTTLGPVGIEVDGAASTINLAAVTAADGSRFVATNGGVIQPAVLANYGAGPSVGTISAAGSGSVVDFSSVTSYSGGTFSRADVLASAGGRVELDKVTQITTGTSNVHADGAGSRIVFTDLTTYTRDYFGDTGRLRASNGGSIETPNLTTLGRVSIEVAGAASSIDLADVSASDTTSYFASGGGVISAPALTSYSGAFGSTIRADDPGSMIDLSNVTSFAAGTFFNTDIYAVGGTIDLSGLTAITTGSADIRATSSGHIDLSSLATYSPNNNGDSRVLQVDTGGTIQFHALAKTTVTNTDMSLSMGGQMHAHELELGAMTSFQATGTFMGDLTNVAGSLRPGFNNAIGELAIDGDFQQASAGTLRIEASSVLQFDTIDVDGDAILAGNLHITPLAGFAPVYGAGIDIINVTGNISGIFNSVTWDGLFGWRVEYLPSVVRLLAQFGADFDEDGDVDDNDLLIWQGNYGMTDAVHTDGDSDDDGDVDGRDFLTWQRQYTGPGMLAASVTVPEPEAPITLILLLCGLFRRPGLSS